MSSSENRRKRGDGRHDPVEEGPRTSSGSLNIHDPRSVPVSNPLFPRESTRLTAIEHDFVRQVHYRELKTCIATLAAHPALRSAPGTPRRYLNEAINALVDNDRALANNCIEKSLLIEKWFKAADESETRLKEYLDDLLNNRTEINRFDADLYRLHQHCEEQADLKRQSLRSNDPQEGVIESFSKVRVDTAVSGSERHAEKQPESRAVGTGFGQAHPDATESGKHYRHKGKSLGRHHSQRSDSHASAEDASTAAPGRVHLPSYRGLPSSLREDGHSVILPPNFNDFVRKPDREAGQFFRRFRVFAVVVISPNDRILDDDKGFQAKTRDGDAIIAHISYRVVVKECHGFCWTVGLNTYGGHGISKKRLNQADIDAHAVAYEEGREPFKSPEEPYMQKASIAIKPAKGVKLSKMSRLNFAKPYTVEHNRKHLDIGMIAERSRPNFVRYCRDHLHVDSAHSQRPTHQDHPAPLGPGGGEARGNEQPNEPASERVDRHGTGDQETQRPRSSRPQGQTQRRNTGYSDSQHETRDEEAYRRKQRHRK